MLVRVMIFMVMMKKMMKVRQWMLGQLKLVAAVLDGEPFIPSQVLLGIIKASNIKKEHHSRLHAVGPTHRTPSELQQNEQMNVGEVPCCVTHTLAQRVPSTVEKEHDDKSCTAAVKQQAIAEGQGR